MAYVQDDAKKLVAYSSVSHLGFVVLGHPDPEPAGRAGGAVPDARPRHRHRRACSSRSGLLYDRRHTRRLSDFGGLWKQMPIFAACFLVIVLASVGPAGPVRVRRRVPGAAGHVHREQDLGRNGMTGTSRCPS
jgi:NADH-quinone oxidoreductase subunit M